MPLWLVRLVGLLMFERPAQKYSFDGLFDLLQASGLILQQRFNTATETIKNRRQLNHIITIERWSQQRLKVFLGEAFVRDESDGYTPVAHRAWSDLVADFTTTRQITLDLAQQLTMLEPRCPTVEHNTAGPISAKGWLKYIDTHGQIEAKRLQ